MSRYDADDVYCIQGTAVLKNKAGITDQDQLDEYEGDFTASCALNTSISSSSSIATAPFIALAIVLFHKR